MQTNHSVAKTERHGLSKSPEYTAWSNIKNRCYNPNDTRFEHYGGRGITVCAEWQSSFIAFLNNVGRRPSKGYTLERINNNGNYEPGNVRWATWEEQASNTQRSRHLTFQGQTKTMSEWARTMNLKVTTVSGRLYRGWSVEKTLTTPSAR